MYFLENLQNLIIEIIDLLPPIDIAGFVEIIIFTYLIYKIIIWIVDSRAYNLLRGSFIITAFVIISYVFHFKVIFEILKQASGVIIILLVVIFQTDIRQAIERLGSHIWFNKLFNLNRNAIVNSDKYVSDICRSVFEMSKVKTGALIVIKHYDDLTSIIDTGIRIDGKISSQLIKNIFEKNTPLHDGAVVIDNDLIIAATCYLPMSNNLSISKNLGTRHRAGIGISEITDAFTIIVSEETGNVSVAYMGELKTFTEEKMLANELYQTIYKVDNKDNSKDMIGMLKGWFNKNDKK